MARRAGGMEVEGDKELIAKFDKLDATTKPRIMRDTLFAAGLPIMNEWKRTAPYKTGQYKRSIHQRLVKMEKTRVEIMIGTDITNPPYPAFLEFGYTTKSGKTVAPKPTARNAYSKKRKAAIVEASKVFSILLERAVK